MTEPPSAIPAQASDGAQPPASPLKRISVWSWIGFDFAAQPFFTVVLTFVFGPYFVAHLASDPAEANRPGRWPRASRGSASPSPRPSSANGPTGAGRSNPCSSPLVSCRFSPASRSGGPRPARRLAGRGRGGAGGRRGRTLGRSQRHASAEPRAPRLARARVQHRLGHRLCRRHSGASGHAGRSGGRSRKRPDAARPHALVRARSCPVRGRARGRAARRALVCRLCLADVSVRARPPAPGSLESASERGRGARLLANLGQ